MRKSRSVTFVLSLKSSPFSLTILAHRRFSPITTHPPPLLHPPPPRPTRPPPSTSSFVSIGQILQPTARVSRVSATSHFLVSHGSYGLMARKGVRSSARREKRDTPTSPDLVSDDVKDSPCSPVQPAQIPDTQTVQKSHTVPPEEKSLQTPTMSVDAEVLI